MRLLIFLWLPCLVFSQSEDLAKADSYFALGNYSKAIEIYTSQKDSLEVYDKIARSYQALGLHTKALIYYERDYNAFPEDELKMYNYAKMLYSTKKYNEASDLFEKLIYKDFNNPNYYYHKGLVLEKMADSMELAMEKFSKACRLDDSHQKSAVKSGAYYLKKRKHKLVDYFVDRALVHNPKSASLLSLKAQNFYWKEDYISAIKWFEKLIDLGESTEFIHEKLSLSYGQEYEYEKAIEHRKKVLEFNKTDANSMYVIGQYYMALKDYDKAEKYILNSLALTDLPLDDEYSKLGTVYNYQKKYKEAIDAFKISLKENPNNIFSQFFLVTTKEAYYKDIDAKIKAYEDFMKNYPKHPMLSMAENKIKDLKAEKFMKEEKN